MLLQKNPEQQRTSEEQCEGKLCGCLSIFFSLVIFQSCTITLAFGPGKTKPKHGECNQFFTWSFHFGYMTCLNYSESTNFPPIFVRKEDKEKSQPKGKIIFSWRILKNLSRKLPSQLEIYLKIHNTRSLPKEKHLPVQGCDGCLWCTLSAWLWLLRTGGSVPTMHLSSPQLHHTLVVWHRGLS